MITTKKIKVGKTSVAALCMKLQTKSLIVMRGNRGYIMCGYLDLKAAQKFGDAAVKITGVSNIGDALQTTVHSCTREASLLGVRKGQSIKDTLRLIA